MASKFEKQDAANKAAKEIIDKERYDRSFAANRQKEAEQLQRLKDYKTNLETIVSKMSIKNLPFRGNVPYSSYNDIMEITPDEFLVPLLNQLYTDAEFITSILVQRYPKLPFPRKFELRKQNGQRVSR